MKKKTYTHFKDNIRRTFIVYALVPVIIITFFSYVISFTIWYRTVVDQNHSINSEVSKRIESIVSSYVDKAYKLAVQEDIVDCITSQNISSTLYEEFYSYVNSMDIRCNFFIFDNNMQPVIASTTIKPEYAQKEIAFSWGIISRLISAPDQVVLSRESSERASKQVLTVGKAIVKNGRILGYLTFDLDDKGLVSIISRNFSTHVVVTDQYGNVISSTNALLINKFGKIDDSFKDKSGFIKSTSDSHYVTNSKIQNESICIYTITSVGHFAAIFMIVGILLVILFCMLTATTYLSARKIASSKTKVIDDIVEAIGHVQNGKLDRLLEVHTHDEFQIIAESYNQMLNDIQNLIEVNKEKARQTVLSEIKQLESQFNPHFLFNTLETIKYMAKMEPSSVNKVIVSLSTLLRYSINNSISEVTLGEDIEYTKNYLLIQKYRFNKKFDYAIKIEDGADECIVPKLIIQPIIENAIKYGFENKNYLSVQIKASFIEENLVIVIYDDGVGMEPEQLEEIKQILNLNKNHSTHIGLFNVNRRIQLMYGEKYGIQIFSEKNTGTVVKMILPINRRVDCHAESADC